HSKTQQLTQTEIQINIVDENDHYPIFDNLHEEYVYISTHHHQTKKIFIAHIHATDTDVGLNGLINYYFRIGFVSRSTPMNQEPKGQIKRSKIDLSSI
ncbi:unnamed protein product, partial [Rotaria sp. Silwood2]